MEEKNKYDDEFYNYEYYKKKATFEGKAAKTCAILGNAFFASAIFDTLLSAEPNLIYPITLGLGAFAAAGVFQYKHTIDIEWSMINLTYSPKEVDKLLQEDEIYNK